MCIRDSFHAGADANAQGTIAAAKDAAASGLYLPVSAGLGALYTRANGDAIALEVMYRYHVMAPSGFGGFSVVGGVRYHF